MNTREAFEAWAEDHAFVFERSTLPGRTYVYFNTEATWKAWQAATSRQEAKIKALVDVLESIGVEDYINTVIDEHVQRYGETYYAGTLALYHDEKLQYLKAIAAAKETP